MHSTSHAATGKQKLPPVEADESCKESSHQRQLGPVLHTTLQPRCLLEHMPYWVKTFLQGAWWLAWEWHYSLQQASDVVLLTDRCPRAVVLKVWIGTPLGGCDFISEELWNAVFRFILESGTKVCHLGIWHVGCNPYFPGSKSHGTH